MTDIAELFGKLQQAQLRPYGMLISAFARTQIAALFGTAILTVLPAISFAGMLVPVSALSGIGQIMGRGFPMTYFLPISVGTFTKGLALAEITGNLAALAVFIPALSWRVGLRPASKSRSNWAGGRRHKV